MEKARITNSERILLTTGKKLELKFKDNNNKKYTYFLEVDKKLGEGSSSVCYLTTVYKKDSEYGHRRVLKQFYPHPMQHGLDIDMKEDGLGLNIKGYKKDNPQSIVNIMGERFEWAYKEQSNLANELPDIIVQPDVAYFDGCTKYALYIADGGDTPVLDENTALEDIINFFYEFAVSLEKLHKQGIIHMDLKPENVLWLDNKVKFFDFDSSVDVNKISELKISDIGLAQYEGLSAPELRELTGKDGEFEQDKRNVITVNLDIYSYGAMLFYSLLGRYPNLDECESRDYENQIFQLFNSGRFRGCLTEAEQKLLCDIIWKCIQYDRGPSSTRYNDTSELVNDIKKLYHAFNIDIQERQQQYEAINTRVQAGYVMDKYPLYRYRRKQKDGTYVLDVCIAGEDPICDEFFKNIFSCVHMLDTRLVIRMVGKEDALTRFRKFEECWPLIVSTNRIYIDGKLLENDRKGQKIKLNNKITRTPFADFYFVNGNIEEHLKKLDEKYESEQTYSLDSTWVIVADSDIKRNKIMAEALGEMLENNSSKQQEYFIGYLAGRGDGYDMEYSNKSTDKILIKPFSSNAKHTIEEKDFEKDIRGRAKLLHKYYMREWDECANNTEIWKSFSSETYNIYSSLCSVLSIPYKLMSVGIDPTDVKEAARDFYNKVLNSKDSTNLNKLIYLEHVRWMCFMITEGYDRPNNVAINNYAFVGKNDQRDKINKLHPCISACGEENGMVLDNQPHSVWDDENQTNNKDFDELDRVSLTIHQICKTKMKNLSVDEGGVLKEKFDELDKCMHIAGFNKTSINALSSLKNVCRKMLINESNINDKWSSECKKFQDVIKQNTKNLRVQEAFEEIKNLMRVAVEHNKYHDYKSSDKTILQAIPFLLTSDNAIGCIHKPVGKTLWQDVMSSLILEPKKLILYSEHIEQVDVERIKKFLNNMRGLNTKIEVRTMNDLDEIRSNYVNENHVVDVTGISLQRLGRIEDMTSLKDVPIIYFENGKLNNKRGDSVIDYYNEIKRHLSVKETFYLFKACIYSEGQPNLMVSLGENYESIWNAYLDMGSYAWRTFVKILYNNELKNYWHIRRVKLQDDITENYVLSRRQVRDSNLDKLLSDLKSKKLIEHYSIPEYGTIGTVQLVTKYEDVAEYFHKIIEKVINQPYQHQFYLLEIDREPVSGKPLDEKQLYIQDDTLTVECFVKDGKERREDDDSRKELVNRAIKALVKENGADNSLIKIIGTLNGKPEIENTDDGAKLHFVFRNHATKECMLREGNVLETYIYHTIWNDVQVDDVKLNVAFVMNSDNVEEALDKSAVTNEVDIVCTKNMQTYFISCKQSLPKNDHIYEIRCHTQDFGIEGKAILICSNRNTSEDIQDEKMVTAAQRIASRSDYSNIYYIDRSIMGDSKEDMKSDRLVKYIKDIFDDNSIDM